MGPIFVSYSHRDRDLVTGVVDDLKSRGLDVWWDGDLSPGVAFARKIEKQIHDSQHVVVVWTRNSRESEWVYSEATLARQLAKFAQANAKGVSPPLPFTAMHSIEFGRDDAEAKLKDLVGRLINGTHEVGGGTNTRSGKRPFFWTDVLIATFVTLAFALMAASLTGVMLNLLSSWWLKVLLGVASGCAGLAAFAALVRWIRRSLRR